MAGCAYAPAQADDRTRRRRGRCRVRGCSAPQAAHEARRGARSARPRSCSNDPRIHRVCRMRLRGHDPQSRLRFPLAVRIACPGCKAAEHSVCVRPTTSQARSHACLRSSGSRNRLRSGLPNFFVRPRRPGAQKGLPRSRLLSGLVIRPFAHIRPAWAAWPQLAAGSGGCVQPLLAFRCPFFS